MSYPCVWMTIVTNGKSNHAGICTNKFLSLISFSLSKVIFFNYFWNSRINLLNGIWQNKTLQITISIFSLFMFYSIVFTTSSKHMIQTESALHIWSHLLYQLVITSTYLIDEPCSLWAWKLIMWIIKERSWAGTYDDADIKIIATMAEYMDECNTRSSCMKYYGIWMKMTWLWWIWLATSTSGITITLSHMCAGKKWTSNLMIP